MKRLLALLFFVMLSSSVTAAPIDLSDRQYMVNAIAAQIISGQTYCWGNVTSSDRTNEFVRLYGHEPDARFTKDVIARIGDYIDLMGKSVQNYQNICNYGILVHLRIHNKLK